MVDSERRPSVQDERFVSVGEAELNENFPGMETKPMTMTDG